MSRKSLEFAKLLDPISGEAPTGESLRYDPVYDQIAHARTQEPTLSQGVWKRETQQADWPSVEELCTDALAKRSKDLQLAVWLTEAWLHRYGLSGLVAGANLITELHRLYPAALIPAPESTPEPALPLPEDPAVEHRLNMVQWMNERFALELKLVPLTAPPLGSELAPVSIATLESSLHGQQVARKAGTPDKAAYDADLVRGLKLTPADYLTELWTELGDALEAVDRLDKTLDRVYGRANGGLLRIREVLARMQLAIQPAVELLAQETLSAQTAAQVTPETYETQEAAGLAAAETREDGGELVVSGVSAHSSGLPGPAGIETREQAYEMLGTIANFLAQLEPHSPVPYLLRRAIAWGGMSLMELLPELLQDQAALKDVGHLLRLSADGAGR